MSDRPTGEAATGTMPPAAGGDGRSAPTHAVHLSDGRTLLMEPHACFACGELNVHGLHLRLHVDSGTCWSEPVLEERFAGWKGIAHGGVVTAILDEVMAWSLFDEDCWGVTARLSMEFRNPVPVGRRLRAEGKVVERRRRLLRTEGRLLDADDGTLYATAEATYVDAPRARKDELKRRYGYRLLGPGGEILEDALTGPAGGAGSPPAADGARSRDGRNRAGPDDPGMPGRGDSGAASSATASTPAVASVFGGASVPAGASVPGGATDPTRAPGPAIDRAQPPGDGGPDAGSTVLGEPPVRAGGTR